MLERLRWAAVAVVLLAAPTAIAQVPPPAERTQFVLLGFDVTPSATETIEDTDLYSYWHAVNRGRRRSGVAGGYTLFLLSNGLQLDPATRSPPAEIAPLVGRPPRRGTLHYARDVEQIRRKIANIRTLAALGVEMASHGVRHRHGRVLGEQAWRDEIADVVRIAELHGIPGPLGFRAPFLETNEHFFTALGAHGLRYDASGVGGMAWPRRDPRTGVWRFEVPTVRVPGRRGPVLFYDENLRNVLRARARERSLIGAEADRFVEDAFVAAGVAAFEERYRGARAPFLVGGHGVIRAATVRLLRGICRLEHVRCATFSEAVRYLERHPGLEGLGESRARRR